MLLNALDKVYSMTLYYYYSDIRIFTVDADIFAFNCPKLRLCSCAVAPSVTFFLEMNAEVSIMSTIKCMSIDVGRYMRCSINVCRYAGILCKNV